MQTGAVSAAKCMAASTLTGAAPPKQKHEFMTPAEPLTETIHHSSCRRSRLARGDYRDGDHQRA